MLPQQSLMLRVAAEAIGDAGWDPRLALRTGVLIGIGLDLNTTNFHLRWSLADRAGDGTESWGSTFPPRTSPAGSTNCARRPGRPCRPIGRWGRWAAWSPAGSRASSGSAGPSFTVSCDETSGIQAMAIAVDWLRRGELDAAIVGAVDFAGDPRTISARRQLQAESSGAMGTGLRCGCRRGRLPRPEAARRRATRRRSGLCGDPRFRFGDERDRVATIGAHRAPWTDGPGIALVGCRDRAGCGRQDGVLPPTTDPAGGPRAARNSG